MSAYLIADVVSIEDAAAYERYKPLVPPTLDRYGGEYLARSGPVTVLEGDWHPSRLVIVRFDRPERASEWWASPQYIGPKQLRQQATTTNMVIVEGV
jgi:uncharacterized protein (DUF1330 family)